MSLERAGHAFPSEQVSNQIALATIHFYAERLVMFRAATRAKTRADLSPQAMKSWLVGLRHRAPRRTRS